MTVTDHASPSTSAHSSTAAHQTTFPPASTSLTSQTQLTPSTPTQMSIQTDKTSLSLPTQTTTANLTANQTGSPGPSVQAASQSTNVPGNTTAIVTSAGQTPTVTWLYPSVYAPQSSWRIFASLWSHLLFHSVVKLPNTNYFLKTTITWPLRGSVFSKPGVRPLTNSGSGLGK